MVIRGFRLAELGNGEAIKGSAELVEFTPLLPGSCEWISVVAAIALLPLLPSMKLLLLWLVNSDLL